MTELPKRQLGRTGLAVTMLGYGAMELRGAPRGRDVTDAQASSAPAPSADVYPEAKRRLDAAGSTVLG